MSIPMSFERAEGWALGNPEVFYRPEVVEKLGKPNVDYDALHQFFIDDLQVPRDFDVQILLYGTLGRIRDKIYGDALGSYHLFSPHTIRVNAVKAEALADYRFKTMGVVAHEGRHLSDRVNRPFKTIGEITLGGRDQYEQRASEQQEHESLLRHQDDISFVSPMLVT